MMKSANKMTAVGINAILCLAFFEGGWEITIWHSDISRMG